MEHNYVILSNSNVLVRVIASDIIYISEFSDFLYYHPFGSLITFGLAGRPAFFSRDFLDL